jgi:glutaconate CoA-transferase, subunit B
MNKVADFLVVNLEKEIKEGETIVQGTSTFIPLIATLLAMQNKKINLIGGFYLNPKINPKIPSTFCPENFIGGKISGLSEFLNMLEEGKVDLEFLRPAQVDKFGNINNTVIGEYKNPKIRLPGGMGIDDVVHFLKRPILYIPDHNTKVFVEKVDFKTASGWDTGKGPNKIITNMCIFEFINKKITLTKINPDYSVEEVIKNTGFKFQISDKVEKMILVDEKTKKIIENLDPLDLRNLEIKDKREEVLEKFR